MVDHVIDVIMVGITVVLSQAIVPVSAKCLTGSKQIVLYISIGQSSMWHVNWVWCS
jgi:hypothetical protein